MHFLPRTAKNRKAHRDTREKRCCRVPPTPPPRPDRLSLSSRETSGRVSCISHTHTHTPPEEAEMRQSSGRDEAELRPGETDGESRTEREKDQGRVRIT